MKGKILLSGLLLLLISSVGFSQTAKEKVEKRQLHQQARINEGISSGEITKAEARNLRRQQRSVNKTERIVKVDGVVTRRERALIKKKQKQASRNIATKKHNKREVKVN